MRIRIIALASAALIGLVACTGSNTADSVPGVVVPEPFSEPLVLYSPESRDALALGLPDQIGGMPLLPSDDDKIIVEQDEYASDPRVRQILVEGGLSPERVTVAQKTARVIGSSTAIERIPPVAIAAIQVKDLPAERFVAWDASFYLFSTAVDDTDYEWQGEKPGHIITQVADRDVSLADYTRFKVAWYPYGDVLYIVVAANDQYLEEAVERLPQPREAA